MPTLRAIGLSSPASDCGLSPCVRLMTELVRAAPITSAALSPLGLRGLTPPKGIRLGEPSALPRVT